MVGYGGLVRVVLPKNPPVLIQIPQSIETYSGRLNPVEVC